MTQEHLISIEDFPKICRLCLTSDEVLPILSIDELETLLKITHIGIDINDNLPRNICNKCLAQLKVISYFINTCKKSYDILRSIASKQKSVCNEISSNVEESNIMPGRKIKSELENDMLDKNMANYVIPMLKTEVSETVSEDMENEDEDLLPVDNYEKELEAILGTHILPKKSVNRYWQEYELFIKWCGEHNVSEFNEQNLLIYFESKSKHYKSPTLWCMYSKLKSTINIKHKVNIGAFPKLLAFLKQINCEYTPKAFKALDLANTDIFVNTAPDDIYLIMKVALIIAICTGCRINQLVNLNLDNVKDRGDIILISMPGSRKTGNFQSACVTNCTWIETIRKYIALRPPECKVDRLFIKYKNNKCIKQPVGKNTFASMPSKIAKFLNLENPEAYTGRCFRQSSELCLQDN